MTFLKEAGRDTSEAVIIGTTPDVCLTPVGNSQVPVPYMVHATLSQAAAATAGTVNFTDQPAYTTASHVTKTIGDAPGTGGGVVSSTVGDKCEFITDAGTVKVEGSPTVRNGDTAEMNGGNCTGECVYIRDPNPNSVVPTEPYSPNMTDMDAEEIQAEALRQWIENGGPAQLEDAITNGLNAVVGGGSNISNQDAVARGLRGKMLSLHVRISGTGGPYCEEVNKEIKKLRNELVKRRMDMLSDVNNLFNLAFQVPNILFPQLGTWMGHVLQFQGKQAALRTAIELARRMGCPITTPDAEHWAYDSFPPDRPL